MRSYPYICMLSFRCMGSDMGIWEGGVFVGGSHWWGVGPMLTNHILAQKVMFGDAAKP